MINTPTTRRFVSLALLVDAATLLVILLILPTFRPMMAEPSGMNTLYLTLVYIPFLIGIFMLRKLQPTPPATGAWLSPVVRGVLAGLFGLMLTTLLAWQLGFFESLPSADPRVLGEGEAAAYFVFAPGAWIGVSMLYILFLAFPVNETVEPTAGRYTAFSILGLITTGLMLVMMIAQDQALLAFNGSIGWMLVGFGLLLALFIPPRLLYASRVFALPSRPATITLMSLAIVLVAGAWLMAGR